MNYFIPKIILTIVLLFSLSAHAVTMGRIPSSSVAYAIYDIKQKQFIHEHNADRPMNPASVMKLVTTYAALDTLGERFRWQTQWTSRASIQHGVLDGNIYWRGSGDPVFNAQALSDMQNQLKKKGIRNISGSLIMDRSIWSHVATAANFGNDKGRWFTVAPDPHHLAATKLSLSSLCESENDENCQSPAVITDKKETSQSANRFVEQWRFLGGEGVNQVLDGTAPNDAKVLAKHYSPPLSEVVRIMNKQSNNLIARSIFLTLGTSFSAEDTIEIAKNTIKESLSRHGIDPSSLVLENGSGLSRVERVSARMLALMLADAYQQSFSKTFIDSLPIAGVDGTLKRRLKDMPTLHLKTGTLKNVRAYAGYFLPNNRQQNPLAVVVIVNHDGIGSYLHDIDVLTKSLVSE